MLGVIAVSGRFDVGVGQHFGQLIDLEAERHPRIPERKCTTQRSARPTADPYREVWLSPEGSTMKSAKS